MSWSLAYTSKMGLVKDSYHRIPLMITVRGSGGVEVAELDKIEKLVSAGMKHLIFFLHGDGSEAECAKVVENLSLYLERLQDANLGANLFMAVFCANFNFINNEELMDFLCQRGTAPDQIVVGCIVVSLLCDGVVDHKEAENYLDVISQFGKVKAAIRKRSEHVKIGLADVYHRKTLQHVYEAFPGDIAVAIPGDSGLPNLPNLRCRNIEYIHSQGCNVYLHFSADALQGLDRDHVPTLEPILDEYTMARGNIDTLLVKMLVQYGPMVCVDASNLSFEYLKEHFAFMCDPFTYRTAQQAPTVVKRFVVAKTHVDDLVLQSEELECAEDEHWMRHYLHAQPQRALVHDNPILKDKISLARKFDQGGAGAGAGEEEVLKT